MADDDKALVERLRANDTEIYLPILGEAADRIEDLSKENDRLNANLAVEAKFVDKLSAENERLRDGLDAALNAIEFVRVRDGLMQDEDNLCSIARAALGEK